MSKPNGVILYQGPSLLDGAPIVAIAIGLNSKSTNRKTGAMVQTYILRSDVEPTTAIKQGLDASICGDCPLRGDGTGKERRCYVNVGQGPLGVYRAFKRGRYPSGYAEVNRMFVRLGTYGDPAAVPAHVWQTLLAGAAGHTGYTHQWRTAPQLRTLCMASVDSLDEAAEARALGWRTFRVGMELGYATRGAESLCPASAEAGKKLKCEQCLACGGADGRKGSIYIPAHGGFAVMANVRKLSQIPVRIEA